MPLKIRCTGCQKALNVPDRARGKAIKCPNCETVLRIPAATAAAAPAGVERPPATPAAERDDFLAGVDLRRAVDSRVRVCVKCGTEVDEEVVDCPECGHNVDTGVISDYMRKKRERKGPDPEEFWGVAWTGSFKFVKQNIPLALRTGMYWSLFLALSYFAAYCRSFCTSLPMLLFWTAAGVLFSLGYDGWYWFCNINVIRHTMSPKRNKRLKDVHFDFYQCVALGIKAHVWPIILLLPAFLALLAFFIWSSMATGSVLAGLGMFVIGMLGILLLGLLALPAAMVHMSMPYTYKAWTPYHMAISVGKTILPSLYWFVMALAALLPVFAVMLTFHLTWDGGLSAAYQDAIKGIADITLWIMESLGMVENLKFDGAAVAFKIVWWAIPIFFAIGLLLIWLVVTPFCLLFGFLGVFLMRANGYIGLYFRDKLDLVKEQQPNVPCGFWPRYLAHLVDTLILGLASTGVWFTLFGLVLLVIWADLSYLGYIFYLCDAGYSLTFPWFYYAKPESNPAWRGSIGKRALGIVVVKDDEKFDTLDFGTASGRFWVKTLLFPFTLGIGWVMAAFTEKKQALHDTLLKTLVVWEGDDERNQI
jgi:uncharacterized RDD family membrane protein YckC/predicted RNA-binding Zn-ribbon protein involved in translation (DUF1610 family)